MFLLNSSTKWGAYSLKHDQADTLMKTHSRLPNCFVLVKDEEDLVIATGSVQETEELQKKMLPANKLNRSKSRLSTSQSSDSDSQYPSSQFTARQKRETAQYSQNAQKFAQGGLTVLKKNFITDVKKVATLLDPKDFTIAPRSNFRRARVNDMRPLFVDQISGKKSNENISAMVYLKRYRNGQTRSPKFFFENDDDTFAGEIDNVDDDNDDVDEECSQIIL